MRQQCVLALFWQHGRRVHSVAALVACDTGACAAGSTRRQGCVTCVKCMEWARRQACHVLSTSVFTCRHARLPCNLRGHGRPRFHSTLALSRAETVHTSSQARVPSVFMPGLLRRYVQPAAAKAVNATAAQSVCGQPGRVRPTPHSTPSAGRGPQQGCGIAQRLSPPQCASGRACARPPPRHAPGSCSTHANAMLQLPSPPSTPSHHAAAPRRHARPHMCSPRGRPVIPGRTHRCRARSPGRRRCRGATSRQARPVRRRARAPPAPPRPGPP